jgi:hypothetical protein
MWKYPDGTVKQFPPKEILVGDMRIFWKFATPEQRKSAGYHEYRIEQPPQGYTATAWEEVDVDGVVVKRPKAIASKPLDELRERKRAEIQAEKKRVRDGGFLVDGVLFNSDAHARTAYLELANELQADPAYTTRWKASDGVWVDMDVFMYGGVKAAGKALIQDVFAWQAAKEQELMAAQTPEEIQEISTVYPE